MPRDDVSYRGPDQAPDAAADGAALGATEYPTYEATEPAADTAAYPGTYLYVYCDGGSIDMRGGQRPLCQVRANGGRQGNVPYPRGLATLLEPGDVGIRELVHDHEQRQTYCELRGRS